MRERIRSSCETSKSLLSETSCAETQLQSAAMSSLAVNALRVISECLIVDQQSIAERRIVSCAMQDLRCKSCSKRGGYAITSINTMCDVLIVSVRPFSISFQCDVSYVRTPDIREQNGQHGVL